VRTTFGSIPLSSFFFKLSFFPVPQGSRGPRFPSFFSLCFPFPFKLFGSDFCEQRSQKHFLRFITNLIARQTEKQSFSPTLVRSAAAFPWCPSNGLFPVNSLTLLRVSPFSTVAFFGCVPLLAIFSAEDFPPPSCSEFFFPLPPKTVFPRFSNSLVNGLHLDERPFFAAFLPRSPQLLSSGSHGVLPLGPPLVEKSEQFPSPKSTLS